MSVFNKKTILVNPHSGIIHVKDTNGLLITQKVMSLVKERNVFFSYINFIHIKYLSSFLFQIKLYSQKLIWWLLFQQYLIVYIKPSLYILLRHSSKWDHNEVGILDFPLEIHMDAGDLNCQYLFQTFNMSGHSCLKPSLLCTTF